MNIVMKYIILFASLSLTSCSSAAISHPHTASQTITAEANANTIWEKLQPLSTAKLTMMQNNSHDPAQIAWIQLAKLTKQKDIDSQQFIHELSAWRASNPFHPANELFPSDITLTQLATQTVPQHIAILLPESGAFTTESNAIRKGIMDAYYASSSIVGKQTIKFYDTTRTKNIITVYQQAINEGADFIIGPLVKDKVQALNQHNSLKVPILALNYTEQPPPANVYEFGLSPLDELTQMANRARQAGLLHVLVIAPNTAWGKRVATTFTTHWQALGGSIEDHWYFVKKADLNKGIANLLKVDLSADKKLMQDNNDKTVLEKQRRHDFDAIILLTQAREARTIVPLLKYYYADNVPIYAISAVYSGTKDTDLSGVMVCDIPWNATSKQNNRLFALGQDAYHLSQSLPRITQLPNFPMYSATGALVMDANHQIHRRIPCTKI